LSGITNQSDVSDETQFYALPTDFVYPDEDDSVEMNYELPIDSAPEPVVKDELTFPSSFIDNPSEETSVSIIDSDESTDTEVDYSLKLSDFLSQVTPDFEFPETLAFLKDQTITTLNVILKLVTDLYKASKNNLADIGSAVIHVLNFYMSTRNSTGWADITVGFASLCLSLFKLDTVKNSAKYVQQIVGTFMNHLKTYFIKAESAETSLKGFWKDLSVTNPRTLFGIVHSCSGILTSVICIKNFITTAHSEGDVVSLISQLTNGILKIGSDFRQHAESITMLLARIYDWIYMNSEALMTFKFDSIIWELPKDQLFEAKYVEMNNIMMSYLSDPLYLETNNLKLEHLRDRLYKLRSEGENHLNKEPTPSARGAISRYLISLDDYIRTVEHKLNPDNTKVQPLSVTLLGSAGSGKTCASSKIGLMMQKIVDRSPNEDLINCRGGDPKFEENITGSTDVIIFDDYANDQSQKMQTKDVLDIVNTSKEVIPKSRSEEKGKHTYNNIGTIFTTNDVDLGMNCFRTASVDSLLRRLGVVMELKIKEQYCLAGTDRLDMSHPEVSDENFNTDVYEVNLKRPAGVMPVPGGSRVQYSDIEYERREGNNEWRDAVIKLQQIFIDHWRTNTARHHKSKDTSHYCAGCDLPSDMCLCEQLTAEAREIKARSNFMAMFYDKPIATAQQKFWALDNWVLDYSSQAAAAYSLTILWRNMAAYTLGRAQMYRRNRLTIAILFIISCFVPFGCLLLLLSVGAYEHSQYKREKHAHMERSLAAGTYIRDHFKARCAAYGILFMTGALSISLMFKSMITISKIVAKPEHAVTTMVSDGPVTYTQTEQEEKKDHEAIRAQFVPPPKKSNSDALGYFLSKPRPAHEARTMTPQQALIEIGRGIAEIEVKSIGEDTSFVKSLPMGSERLVPYHGLNRTKQQDIILRYSHLQGADYKNMDVPMTHIQPLIKHGVFSHKALDAALVHLPNAPSGKDFSKYLAEPGTLPNQAGATYIHKDITTGAVKYVPVRVRMMKDPITYVTKYGTEKQIVYRCEAQEHISGCGDCGQPLIYNNSIIGIHIAGNSTNVWYCLAIDKSTVNRTKETLKQESSIFVSSYPAEPVLKNNLKNLQIADGTTNYVQKELNTDVTPITSLGLVLDNMGQLYRPRAEDYYFKNWNPQVAVEFGDMRSRPPRHVNGSKQINTTLEKFNTPKNDAPISLMDRSVEDYLRGPSADGTSLADYASKLEKESPGFFSVRPLSEALDGDGTGVVRGMNNQTSSGICYGGKKTKYLELDSDGQPVVPRVLVPEVVADIEKIENTWRSGQGTFDPFVRASKTNEVLPLEKAEEKTRSVYGNDMAFFIAATRAIIPVKHVLRNKVVSECCVGVAAQSDEWGQVHDDLTNGGQFSNFVCGDFSGYDTQLPKALLEKSAAVIIQLYKENGASTSDLEYLRGMLTSVVGPVMIWEGQLFQFSSGQPSGQPLTVEMNSIVNSILLRMAFFTIMDRDYPDIKNPSFRRFCRAKVYGDDNAIGVSDEIPLFNHTTIQAVFASWGIKYTMADKGADSVPYQTIEEVSFLKRSFRYHPQLDAIVAPLEEESLMKKFYWWTKTKNTPLTLPEQFQANFESQAREAYLHGEEFYEEFVAKCERIRLASETQDAPFALPWNTLQPISSSEMRRALTPAYHPEE